jgi:alkanesulfonate monooxygenase SsuD/methylene tetrahydromethanopterin reductase-like flavin-dependent oxidoreductase (luciferase family)
VDELVALMRACWSGEAVEHQGRFYQAAGFKMHPRPANGTVPIIWGGHSDAALRRVARLGDGWHPTQIPLDALADGITRLRRYCAEAGRDPAATMIVARPGNTYAITEESHARHRELGVTHLVADTPIPQPDPDLGLLRERMEEVARICELRPRQA